MSGTYHDDTDNTDFEYPEAQNQAENAGDGGSAGAGVVAAVKKMTPMAKLGMGALVATVSGMGIMAVAPVVAPAKKPVPMVATDERSSPTPQRGNTRNSGLPSAVSGGAMMDNALESRIGSQDSNIIMLNHGLRGLQQEQKEAYGEIMRELEILKAAAQGGAAGGALPAIPHAELPPLMRPSHPNERFQGEYQTKVTHYSRNQGKYWALPESRIEELKKPAVNNYVPITQGSYDHRDSEIKPVGPVGFEYILQAGSRIIAITEQVVSSDHPGYFTSRVVSPGVLRGAHLICQQGGQQNDRIPVQVVKVIFNEREYSLSGQVEVGFPGVTGKINRHILGRSVPLIANAAITGGFIAWNAQNNGGDRINTRDAITAEVIGQELPLIQNEIAKFGVARPNTVNVAAGAQFSILLTEKLIVKY